MVKLYSQIIRFIFLKYQGVQRLQNKGKNDDQSRFIFVKGWNIEGVHNKSG